MKPIVLWKEAADRAEADKALYTQLENVISDVRRGMPFARAVKSNDFGLAAAKHRHWRGDKYLECYREYRIFKDSDASDEDIAELFDKYDLPKNYRADIERLPQSINVQFYIRINVAQGDFIREMIGKIKAGAEESNNKLNYNAAWLLARVHAGDFAEAIRGQADIDVNVSDTAKSELKKALDMLKDSKAEQYRQGGTGKTKPKYKLEDAKVLNGDKINND